MEKRVQDYKNDILKIVRGTFSPAMMSRQLQDFHENDIADVMSELTVGERCKLYRILDMDTLSDILEYLDEEEAVTYLEEMNIKKAAAILSKTHLLLRSEQPEEIHLRHNELKYYPDQCFFEQSFQSSQVQHLPH